MISDFFSTVVKTIEINPILFNILEKVDATWEAYGDEDEGFLPPYPRI